MGALAHPFRSALWLLGSLAFPALAAAQTSEAPATSFRFFATAPPWAVEAPGAAGARFGLGLDVFSERQESLRIAGLERILRARDLGSGLEEGGIFREDPGLLNRKFDILLELEGVGTELAVALPGIGTPGAFQVHPTLIFQAAAADVRLDFLDRTRAGDSTSYEGRGPLFTTGLDLTTSLCRSCPWFAGTSYRFQKLPSLSVDRSPAFALPGFTVLGDEVRLARDVHEVSTRIGTSFSGSRVASYLGARHRWTDLVVEDELRYRDSLGVTETRLSSRADLESEATLAIAGVEAHLGGSFYGRMEAGLSEEDRVVVAQVVYLPSWKPIDAPTQEKLKRSREMAERIAPRLTAAHAAFLKGRQSLRVVEGLDGQPAYLTPEIEELLTATEQELLSILSGFPELEALGDWVVDQFRDARAQIGLDSMRQVAEPGRSAFPIFASWPAVRPVSDESQRAQMDRVKSKARADKGLDVIQSTTSTLAQREQLGNFKVRLKFMASFEKPAELEIHPRRNESAGQRLSPGEGPPIDLGSYSWKLFIDDKQYLHCDGNVRGPNSDCPLKIITISSCMQVECISTRQSKRCKVMECR